MGFDISIVLKSWPIFAYGLFNTFIFCAVSIPIGVAFGFIIFLMRSSRRGWLRSVGSNFVGIIRDTPFLVQVYMVFYALPRLGIYLGASPTGVICLSAYGAAYFSETIRGGFLSVARGQMDAALAVGMPRLMAIRRVVLPQALGYLVPALTNQAIGLIKESAILAVITVPEITMSAQIVMGVTFSPVESYTVAALLYWGLTAAVARGGRYWEMRARLPGLRRDGAPSTAAISSALLSRD
jgi:polar amino acid transport system permease protein